MPEGLLALAQALREALIAFDPKRHPGEDCVVLAEALAAAEKACATARVLASARAVECGAHRAMGFADGADWLARTAGTSTVQAKNELETARALDGMPDTGAAMAAGELSLAQAHELTRTEAECPGSESELLDVARRSSLKVLKAKGRQRRLGAIDPEQLHQRQQQARSVRQYRSGLAMVGFTCEFPPESGLPFANRLDAVTDRQVRQAKREGRFESREAHAADAFLDLLAGAGAEASAGVEAGVAPGAAPAAGAAATRRRHSGTDLVIVCDLRAYRRGHAHPGEPVHLVGGGPIPVSLVKELEGDAFVKAVLHDGTRIDTVKHLGRHIKAELRTALALGPVPDFDGVSCSAPDCDRRYRLEWDHADPAANGGPTSFENLQPLCWPHHQAKTARDRKSGLLRGRKDPPSNRQGLGPLGDHGKAQLFGGGEDGGEQALPQSGIAGAVAGGQQRRRFEPGSGQPDGGAEALVGGGGLGQVGLGFVPHPEAAGQRAEMVRHRPPVRHRPEAEGVRAGGGEDQLVEVGDLGLGSHPDQGGGDLGHDAGPGQ
ncbi:MAG: HNH endonuclease signature motif containing protein [Acidimicrobiia bacterium]